MNFGLSKEIYGGIPWMVDPISFNYLSKMLSNFRKGITLEVPDVKYNSMFCLEVDSNTKIVTRPYGDDWNPGQLDNSDEFEAIVVMNINGVITRNGGMSSYGMDYLSQMMLKANRDKRVIGFVLKVDSGGGSSSAVELMIDTINEIKQTKPIYSVIAKGGLAASAAYGIISATNKIFSESKQNIVGSIGTMIEFEGVEANSENDGVKTIRLYATKSTEKNKAFEEAINNDNYSLLINELLDPINENFISMVETNRPQLKGTDFDNGHTEFAKNSIGKFIDGIASFDEVVEMVLSESKNYSSKSNLNINQNSKSSKKMNRQELQQNHPELVNTIREEGVLAERERVNSWLVYQSADPEAVATGIESGAEISASQREKFLVKMNSKNVLENLKNDSANPLKTEESTVEKVEEVVDNKELESAFDFKL